MSKKLNIWMSYVNFPITTAVYFERALRKQHNVITIGPNIPEQLISAWSLEDMKFPEKPLDIPTNFQPDIKEILQSIPRNQYPDLFLWIESVPGFFPQNIDALNCPTAGLLIDTHLNFPKHFEQSKHFDFNFIVHKQYLSEFHNRGRKNVF